MTSKTTLCIFCIAALFFITACNDDSKKLIGTWKHIEKNDSTTAQKGFTLGINGLASSVEDPLNQYNTWKHRRNTIILSGKHFSDTSVVDFSDTMNIIKLSSDTLVLEHNNKKTTYFKE